LRRLGLLAMPKCEEKLVPAKTAACRLTWGDSLGAGGLLLGVFLVIVVLPLALKAFLLICILVGVFLFAKCSHWTSDWSILRQRVVSSIMVFVLLGVAIPQFVSQWKSEHLKPSQVTESNAGGKQPSDNSPEAPLLKLPPPQKLGPLEKSIVDKVVADYQNSHDGKRPSRSWINKELERQHQDFYLTTLIYPTPPLDINLTDGLITGGDGPGIQTNGNVEFNIDGTTISNNKAAAIENSGPNVKFNIKNSHLDNNGAGIVNKPPPTNQPE